MAARGAQSKKIVENRILEVFPEAFINDKKIYINFMEDGEAIQICVSMTCPKALVGEGSRPNPAVTADGGIDFDNFTPKQTNAEFTQQEIDTIEAILSKI